MSIPTEQQMQAAKDMIDTLEEFEIEAGPQMLTSVILTALANIEDKGKDLTPFLEAMHHVMVARGLFGKWLF